MAKKSVRNITDELGLDVLASHLNVSTHSIRHARAAGAFPASWFDVIDGMCREKGAECPRELFNFKASGVAGVTKRGNAAATAQGDAPKVEGGAQ